MREVQRNWGGKYKEIEIRRADDLFAAMTERSQPFSTSARLIKAVFLVKFENAKKPRTVTIRPKNIANYSRNEDGVRIEQWLTNRGFALTPESERRGNERVLADV
ncbi:MAG: hypothetical protein FD149_2279 [Rhodospirillaceae bacterium]|nr:MAG: hypothetical protein FD149_2279 [Rhodospirillaceae bacterium]